MPKRNSRTVICDGMSCMRSKLLLHNNTATNLKRYSTPQILCLDSFLITLTLICQLKNVLLSCNQKKKKKKKEKKIIFTGLYIGLFHHQCFIKMGTFRTNYKITSHEILCNRIILDLLPFVNKYITMQMYVKFLIRMKSLLIIYL